MHHTTDSFMLTMLTNYVAFFRRFSEKCDMLCDSNNQYGKFHHNSEYSIHISYIYETIVDVFRSTHSVKTYSIFLIFF